MERDVWENDFFRGNYTLAISVLLDIVCLAMHLVFKTF